ncbi:hypothetical protein R1sor_027108 [Riccia sorocarpa]|uniref:Uncharacterized protein n=1 Tax=Riccia sorocarpa TaxID=122646 RepID=A0ABD3GDB6_9MARC
MNKRSYMCLLDMICEHHVFHNNSPYPQAEVFVQLAVELDRFGHEGNSACLNRTLLMWWVSHGSIVNYTNRVMTALESAMGHEIHCLSYLQMTEAKESTSKRFQWVA